MKSNKHVIFFSTAMLFLVPHVAAEDIDIFLNPASSSGSTNIMFALDSAGSINAQMTDIDGTAKKTYTVVGNVIKALLDPENLSIKRTVFPATSIVTADVTGCSKADGTTSTCTCSSFGYKTDSANSNNCKMTQEVIDKVNALISSVSLGATLFTGTNSNGSGSEKGGYVAYTVQPMSVDANLEALQDKLTDVPTGNTSMYASTMNEIYRYFTNMKSLAGFAGTTAYSDIALIGYDRRSCGKVNPSSTCSAANDNYVGPVNTNSCTNAILFIGPGEPANGAVEKDAKALETLGGNASIINAGSKDDSNLFDEYARFFAGKDINPNIEGVQSLATYTIITEDPNKKVNTDARLLMQSAARVGGGEFYVASNAVDFIIAFLDALTKIQSVNSAFASVSLPVSVNVRGTNLNQVYVGMFRPDPDGKPRWYGNLKEYQLAYDSTTNDVFLASADGTTRAETNTGSLLADNAFSFWTKSSSFWNFAPSGVPKSGNDLPDGSVVEKGGAAQTARTQFADTTKQATRKVYTCIGCTGSTTLTDTDRTANTAFTVENTTYLTQALLGVTTSAERDNLINWVRGQDIQNENNTTLAPNTSTTDVRASLYGDVLHSRPAVINYNRNTTCTSTDDNDVYIFYGANDGLFKATKGGDNATATKGGEEQWAFIPEEHIGALKKLYDNGATKKPYFTDGSVGTLVEYATTACTGGESIRKVTKATLFVSMRRGGRFIYAIDVTDPVAPKLLWKISNATTGFSELGQTWSEPKSSVVKIGSTTPVATPVVIFGGGYDPAVDDILNDSITSVSADGQEVTTTSDADPSTTAIDPFVRSMGRAVYVVRADTGALVWRATSVSETCPSGATCVINDANGAATLDYSIPGDIGIVDRDRDGYADRLYFGDTGANVWRVNIGDASPANWSFFKLAQLNESRTSETAASARRKILYMPDVVAGPAYDVVVVGTGDREQPFDTSVINRFYSIKDDNTVPANAVTDVSDFYSSGNPDLVELTSANFAAGLTLPSAARGWLYTLANAGEKVVSSPVTLNGISYFNTNRPTPGVCGANLGEARIYALDFLSGAAPVYKDPGNASLPSAYIVVPGGGYLPTGVPAVVKIGDKLREVLIVGTKVSQDIGVVQLGRRVRTYWFQGIDQ